MAYEADCLVLPGTFGHERGLEGVRAARFVFLGSLLLGSLLIAVGSVGYFVAGEVQPFVLEKGRIPLRAIWMLALRVHVVAALWSLPACAALWSRWLLRAHPRVHRWLGRVTGGVILLGLLPSGAWLAFSAKGGLPTFLGFILSGAIVAVATVRGILGARARDFAAHRRCNAHVLAQLSVAVTSRALLVVFDYGGLARDPAYVLALWVPVVVSAWLAHELTKPKGEATARARPAIPAPMLGTAALVCGLVIGARPCADLVAPRHREAEVAADIARRSVLVPLSRLDDSSYGFSRGPQPPDERRLRMTSDGEIEAATGATFVTFAVDSRRGRKWKSDQVVGCVYPATGAVFIREGTAFIPAEAYLGEGGDRRPRIVCGARTSSQS